MPKLSEEDNESGGPGYFCFALWLALVSSGCAFQRAVDTTTNADGKERISYVGVSFFNKSALSGLKVGERSETNSTTISLDQAGTETQADAIRSLGEALGADVASGVKKAVVPVE